MATEALRALQAELNNELAIGYDVGSGAMHYVPLETLLQTHIHCIGPSGGGKTRWCMWLILQLISRGLPFGILSPHRDLYDFAVGAVQRTPRRQRDVILFDPSDERFSVGFNPLQSGLTDPADQASMLIESCVKAWGTRSMDGTPRMERVMRGTFLSLAANRLTLLEAYDFLAVDNRDYRAALLANVDDTLIRADWEEFEKLARSERLTLVESCRNRLQRFYQHPRVQRMIGQTENTLDFYQVMERGQTLLTNLGGLPSPESQRLLGSLLLNSIYHSAKRRDPKRRRPWVLIVDEAAQFVTPDLVNSLDECRKFGLCIVAAHQRLRQLEREDSDLASALMTNARCKVVFSGLERPEAQRLAYEIFAGDVRGDRVKHVSVATKFRPRTEWVDIETDSWSESSADGYADNWSESSGDSLSESESSRFSIAGDLSRINAWRHEDLTGQSISRAASYSSSHGEGGSHSSVDSSGRGGSTTRAPITVHDEFREETGRQFWSLDEEWEQRIGLVSTLPRREMLFRFFNEPVRHLRTPNVELPTSDRRTRRFVERILTSDPHTRPTSVVERQIAERKQRVRALAASLQPSQPASFREPAMATSSGRKHS